MSTQFDAPIVDLDRTDELPVLDVEAYEASLAVNEKSLSRTDTWAVESLRAVEEDESDDDSEDDVPSPTVVRTNLQSEALTINVERILARFADLEAEIVTTRESNAQLQKEYEAARAQLAQEALRIEALQADNARLCADHAQSDEIARRRDQQLRERAESIATLEKTLGNEREIASKLSRQLAVKMMVSEQAAATIEQRDRAIEDLTRDAAELNQRLEQEVATSADLTARLAAAEQSLHQGHALLLEHDGAMEKKDAQLAQAQAQIQSLTEERDTLRSVSTQLDARTVELEQRNVELAQLHGELVNARAEEQNQRQFLKERTDELSALRKTLSEHETSILGFEQTIRLGGEQVKDLTSQLQTARDERAAVDAQLSSARVRAKNLADQIFTRDNRIAVLEADLAVHVEALATIKRDVNRIGQRADAESNEVEHMLEPVGHDHPAIYLTGEVMTVGRTTDNDISIPSKLVSRYHARLLVGPTGVIVEDVKSTNGCYVNGEQVKQYLLQEGDVLELGDMRYRLRTRTVRTLGKHDTKVHQLSTATRKAGPRTEGLG